LLPHVTLIAIWNSKTSLRKDTWH